MPSTSDGAGVDPALNDVITRYHRVERAVSGATALLAGGIGAGLILLLPLWQGVLGAVAVLAGLRLPVVTTAGSARLETTASPATVRAAVTGPRPPMLAFQWGIANEVTATEHGGRYARSSLCGLRSVTMTTTVDDAATTADITLRVTAGDSPWSTYHVTLTDHGDTTVVEIDVRSDRRFGLRGLPAWLVAQRYYDAALEAQGYTVISRERSLSFRGR